MEGKIKIMVAEDHKLVKEAFCSLLNSLGFIEVVGMAENGVEVLELLRIIEPDILFLDVDMPVMNGRTAAIEVKKQYPNVKIIMLSMHAETFFKLEFYKIGVHSYLSKGCSIEELIESINTVQRGEKYFDESVKEALIQNSDVRPINCILNQEPLEEIEIKVLKLVCEGKRGKEIAEILNMSIDTVDYHKKNIKKKTNIESTPELVKHAIKHGFITL